MRVTGFLPDAELAGWLRSVAVPLAPNPRVGASASIATWIGHGRRPLVPDSPYGRELAERAPGTITLYSGGTPGGLRAAIEAALAEPESTWLGSGVWPGPGLPDVAAAYARHFAGCRPAAPIRVGPGRWTVPDNRWDLLAGLEPTEPPAVSVVVPYYQAQRSLDLVLTGLAAQSHPQSRLEVVWPTTGPPRRPTSVPAADFRSGGAAGRPRLPRRRAQPRRRIQRLDGDVLCFLDGDTIPEPGFLSDGFARLPALASRGAGGGPTQARRPRRLGLRRPARWLRSEASIRSSWPSRMAARGIRHQSADLLRVDQRSYRYVISAVCGLSRDLFTELGGFSAEFTAYGGEDWELAHRAWWRERCWPTCRRRWPGTTARSGPSGASRHAVGRTPRPACWPGCCPTR